MPDPRFVGQVAAPCSSLQSGANYFIAVLCTCSLIMNASLLTNKFGHNTNKIQPS